MPVGADDRPAVDELQDGSFRDDPSDGSLGAKKENDRLDSG